MNCETRDEAIRLAKFLSAEFDVPIRFSNSQGFHSGDEIVSHKSHIDGKTIRVNN